LTQPLLRSAQPLTQPLLRSAHPLTQPLLRSAQPLTLRVGSCILPNRTIHTYRRLRTAVSLSECELLRLPKAKMRHLIVTHGDLRVAFRKLAARFLRMLASVCIQDTCSCVCMCVYILTHVLAFRQLNIHTYKHAFIRFKTLFLHSRGQTCACIHTYIHTYIHTRIQESQDPASPIHDEEKHVHIWSAWQDGKIPDKCRLPGKVCMCIYLCACVYVCRCVYGVHGKGERHATSGKGERHVTSGKGERHVTSGKGERHVPSGKGERHVTSGKGERHVTSTELLTYLTGVCRLSRKARICRWRCVYMCV
jgi:hypothetical protein